MGRRNGFTLIELAVAIGVIAILSGVIVPIVLKNLQDAKVAKVKRDLDAIATAVGLQMKDTASRPRSDGGPNGCNGNAAQVWYSEGTHPDASAANVNTFENLLGQKHSAQANHLFGIPDARAETVDPSYKGPYLSAETAKKTDPWGNAYLIVGYNAHGQRDKKGIYIVSGGPDGKIDDANAANPDAWGRGGNSADDFVVQVF